MKIHYYRMKPDSAYTGLTNYLETDSLTIALIDNSPIVQMGMGILLSSHFKALNFLTADNTSIFVNKYGNTKVDLVILGISDRSMRGSIKTARESKKYFPTVPLIAFDQNYHDRITSHYFRSGLRGHILKQSISDDIFLCIEAVLSGKNYVSGIIHQNMLEKWSRNAFIPPMLSY